jgi:hypothetical protein
LVRSPALLRLLNSPMSIVKLRRTATQNDEGVAGGTRNTL